MSYEHYTTRLQSSMNQLGYDGVLLQRRDGQGLATFWHTSMFQMVANKHATLHHLAETHLQVGVMYSTRCDQKTVIDTFLAYSSATNRNHGVKLKRYFCMTQKSHFWRDTSFIHKVTWFKCKFSFHFATFISHTHAELTLCM